MHSSRMRTVRWPSRGDVYLGGVCPAGGVCLEGCLPGGCLPRKKGCTPPPVDRILDTRL